MSAWRKSGLELLPEYQQLIEKSDTPMALWVELTSRFSLEYNNLGDDLIGRFYKYAKWCLSSPGHDRYLSDAGTAAAVVFYEHLPLEKEIRNDVHRWLSKEEFLKLERFFLYHQEPEEYEEFKNEFLEKKAKFLKQIPKFKK